DLETGRPPRTSVGSVAMESQLCQCDKTAADCFARNQNTYNAKLQYYSNLKCHGTAPKC
uniref:Uncharacterized protein n=1 Tax=Catagonus wagneri TaxID=51154 RepID=A0A8C3WDB1_9CETA